MYFILLLFTLTDTIYKGNVYFADTYNYRVRKIAKSTGIISTVAGSGATVSSFDSSGDGGPATSSGMNSPFSVALDSLGNMYIADFGANRVRKVTVSTGIITTFAGSGAYGFSGDGGQATAAGVYFPTAVALDTSGTYIQV